MICGWDEGRRTDEPPPPPSSCTELLDQLSHKYVFSLRLFQDVILHLCPASLAGVTAEALLLIAEIFIQIQDNHLFHLSLQRRWVNPI